MRTKSKKEIRDCSIGVRLTPSLKRILIDDGLPISNIVESGIIYFLKLSTEDKVRFLANNTFEKVNPNDFQRLEKSFDAYLNKYLEELQLENLYGLTLDQKIDIVSKGE